MFNHQYTFNSFYKSEPLDLSDSTIKVIEEVRILLFWLELNSQLPRRTKSINSFSEKLAIFIPTDCKSSKRVALLFIEWWRCRKKWERLSFSKLHKHKGYTQSRKSCLTLFSLRWLRSSLNLTRNFKQMGLWIF